MPELIQLPINAEHVAEALEQIRSALKKLGPTEGADKLAAVMRELWLDSYFEINEMGAPRLKQLTPIQRVALGAALKAFVESGARWDGRQGWGGYSSDDWIGPEPPWLSPNYSDVIPPF